MQKDTDVHINSTDSVLCMCKSVISIPGQVAVLRNLSAYVGLSV